MEESTLGKLVSLFSAVRFASAGATKAPVQHSDPLVWPGFQPRPDSEHDCNTKFSNYAVETICEELSKWRGKEGEGWFTQRFSQEDSAQVLALIKQKPHHVGAPGSRGKWRVHTQDPGGEYGSHQHSHTGRVSQLSSFWSLVKSTQVTALHRLAGQTGFVSQQERS